MITHVLAQETDLTSATNVSSANLVRVHNTGSAAKVTIKDGSTVIGDITFAANEVINLKKQSTWTLEGGVAFKAVKIGTTR